MTTIEQMREVRRQWEREVAAYTVAHPELALEIIATTFGISRRSLDRIRKSVLGQRNRVRGRKPKVAKLEGEMAVR